MRVESIYTFYYFLGEKSSELLDGFFFLKEFLAPGLGVATVDGLEICNAGGKLVTRPRKSLEKTNTVDKDLLVSIFH
jgi:hypothetical protein